MNTDIEMTSRREVPLSRAILVYGESDDAKISRSMVERATSGPRATVHEVLHARSSDRPIVGPGAPLTREVLQSLLQHLAGADKSGHRFLPANLLCADTTLLAWHAEGRRCPIQFSTADKEFNRAVSGKVVPHPPLLFRATPGRLAVYALDSERRPDPRTPLFAAPYCNLYENGDMCTGSVRLPGSLRIEDIPLWEEAFYDSSFTHTNMGRTLTTFRGGHHALWRAMVRHKGDFPVKYLTPLAPPQPKRRARTDGALEEDQPQAGRPAPASAVTVGEVLGLEEPKAKPTP